MEIPGEPRCERGCGWMVHLARSWNRHPSTGVGFTRAAEMAQGVVCLMGISTSLVS